VGSTGYGTNATTATSLTQGQEVRTTTNTKQSETKFFTKTNSTDILTQVNVDLASATGTSVAAGSIAHQGRPVEILRLVLQGHRSALTSAIQHRTSLDSASYLLATPQPNPLGLAPVNADLNAVRLALEGNVTEPLFKAANRILFSNVVKYVDEDLRQHLLAATNIISTMNGAAAVATILRWSTKTQVNERLKDEKKLHSFKPNPTDTMQQVIVALQKLYLF